MVAGKDVCLRRLAGGMRRWEGEAFERSWDARERLGERGVIGQLDELWPGVFRCESYILGSFSGESIFVEAKFDLRCDESISNYVFLSIEEVVNNFLQGHSVVEVTSDVSWSLTV